MKLILKDAVIRSEKGNGRFFGYASVFNVEDLHGDVILPNAFAGNDVSSVKLLWQHNASEPIGRVLNLVQTQYGLLIEGQIIESTEQGKDIINMIADGVIDGLSIGFEIVEAEKLEGKRYISKVKLWEVSIVTFPANPEARIGELKSDSESIEEIREVLEQLRKSLF